VTGVQTGALPICEQAERVFDLMKQLGVADDSLKPDVYTYSTVISAYAKSDDKFKKENASLYLDELKERYANGEKECKPNCMVYGSMIHLLARCSLTKDVVDQAMQCFSDMLLLDELDAKQILMACTTVITMINRSKDHSQTNAVDFVTVYSLYNRMRLLALNLPHLRPNSRVLTALLRCLSRNDAETKHTFLPALLSDVKSFQVEVDQALVRAIKSCT